MQAGLAAYFFQLESLQDNWTDDLPRQMKSFLVRNSKSRSTTPVPPDVASPPKAANVVCAYNLATDLPATADTDYSADDSADDDSADDPATTAGPSDAFETATLRDTAGNAVTTATINTADLKSSIEVPLSL